MGIERDPIQEKEIFLRNVNEGPKTIQDFFNLGEEDKKAARPKIWEHYIETNRKTKAQKHVYMLPMGSKPFTGWLFSEYEQKAAEAYCNGYKLGIPKKFEELESLYIRSTETITTKDFRELGRIAKENGRIDDQMFWVSDGYITGNRRYFNDDEWCAPEAEAAAKIAYLEGYNKATRLLPPEESDPDDDGHPPYSLKGQGDF